MWISGSLFLTQRLMNWLSSQFDAVPDHLLDRFLYSEIEILCSFVTGCVVSLGGSSGFCYLAVKLLIVA
jgi:hypothetical protein